MKKLLDNYIDNYKILLEEYEEEYEEEYKRKIQEEKDDNMNVKKKIEYNEYNHYTLWDDLAGAIIKLYMINLKGYSNEEELEQKIQIPNNLSNEQKLQFKVCENAIHRFLEVYGCYIIDYYNDDGTFIINNEMLNDVGKAKSYVTIMDALNDLRRCIYFILDAIHLYKHEKGDKRKC